MLGWRCFDVRQFLLGCGISNALDDANQLPDMVDNQFSQSEAEAYRNLRYLDYKDDWLFLGSILLSG